MQAQSKPLELTEGNYPLREEEVLEWVQYGLPLQEELESPILNNQQSATANTPILPDEPWLDGMSTEDEGQEF
ncbi:hypothetical protein [Helicobacter suis]|uniref:hypothetical protein n=1 Tax=Helicobacter suis TaxID=104628 RepID=UPI0013D81881|nr:hypothetical protein [Helicobacter suis]